jgi:hypothetical protein
VLTDASNNETRPSTEILEARPETTSDLETTKKPAGSFTAKIDELTRQNLALMTELEQWRSTASKAEALNRELGASLDAARLRMNALQQEKERMKESCHQNAIAANFFRITAVISFCDLIALVSNGTTIVIRRKTRERAVSDIDAENDEDNADLDGEVHAVCIDAHFVLLREGFALVALQRRTFLDTDRKSMWIEFSWPISHDL